MKLLLRFFLSLSFLLISGYSVHADPCKNDILSFSSNHALHSWYADFNQTPEGNAQAVRYTSLPVEKKHFRILATENEDDDRVTLSKKILETSDCFLTFYAKTFGYGGRYIKPSLPYYPPVAYFPSFIYILFRVIRI